MLGEYPTTTAISKFGVKKLSKQNTFSNLNKTVHSNKHLQNLRNIMGRNDNMDMKIDLN